MVPHAQKIPLFLKTIKLPTSHPTWGGRRAGAGRPRKPPVLVSDLPYESDPARWLLNLMRRQASPMKIRTEAAKALLPYLARKA